MVFMLWKKKKILKKFYEMFKNFIMNTERVLISRAKRFCV